MSQPPQQDAERPYAGPFDDELALLLPSALDEHCDRCGSAETWWRNCKLLCRACGDIVRSCADL